MTLIILGVNEDQAIATMDRRLTFAGRLKDVGGEEETSTEKGFALFCEYGRAVVCFTGLAEFGPFSTRKWLMESIAGMPGKDLDEIIEAVTAEATERIGGFKELLPEHRQLTIAMAGYANHESGRRGFITQISNFERFEVPGSNPAPKPGEGFMWQTLRAPPPGAGASVFHVVGAREDFPTTEGEAIAQLVDQRKSAKAIINRSVRAIRKTNDETELVGRNCMSLILPVDPNEVGTTEFHPDDYRPTVEHQFGRVVLEKGLSFIHDAPKTWRTKDEGTRIPARDRSRGGKVGRNDPCPCKSGRKFKKCCGR